MHRLAALNPLRTAVKRSASSSAIFLANQQRILSTSSLPKGINTSWLMEERYNTTSGSLELGVCTKRMGHLSESSVLGRAGGSVVHVAVNSGKVEAPAEDFLPLTVDYRARYSAFGLIANQPNRKEKHGTDDEILVSRFIDRAVRPLFPKGYVDEVQILVTGHSADGVHDPTVIAVNASSLALLRSKQPWFGPIGCVRVGIVNNELKVNPTVKEMEESPLDLLYAGTVSRAVMVEAGGHQIPEERMKEALSLAHNSIQEIIEAQLKAVEADSNTIKKSPHKINDALYAELKERHWNGAVQLYRNNIDQKEGRSEQEGKFRADLLAEVDGIERWNEEPALLKGMAVDSLMHAAFRAAILDQPSPSTQEIVRSDGRKTNELRPITSSLDVLPCVHGSAYFSRGDTHVICSTTLGAYEDSREYMPLNGLGIGKRGFFMLHYDFPPYCTGELGSISQVSRRMIGHGNLAEKAVLPVMPSFEEFPYTVKVHSECTSSNGSSSMASACGSTLSLLSAGVPIKAPVAGVSVGLITEDSFAAYGQVEREQENTIHHGKYVLLKDILGSEDHHGDMDFKVAGTTTGITAIQLDVKLAGGVPLPLLFEGIDLAKVGRLEILDQMLSPVTVDTNPMDASPQVQALLTNKASQHSPAMVNLKPQSPRAELLKFDPDRKSQLIGPNGEMLKFIQDLYDVEVSIVVKDKWIHMQQDYLDKKRTSSTVSSLISSQLHDDEVGVVYIYGQNARYVHEARKLIEDIAVTVKEGDTLQGTIVDVRDYGAIVQINRGQQALLHLYDITYDNDLLKRPMEEILLKGHRLDLQIISVDRATGIVKASRKALLDPQNSVPDQVRLIPPIMQSGEQISEEDALHNLSANFPTTPPRPWQRDFFKLNVATEREVKRAMDKANGIPTEPDEREREREAKKERRKQYKTSSHSHTSNSNNSSGDHRKEESNGNSGTERENKKNDKSNSNGFKERERNGDREREPRNRERERDSKERDNDKRERERDRSPRRDSNSNDGEKGERKSSQERDRERPGKSNAGLGRHHHNKSNHRHSSDEHHNHRRSSLKHQKEGEGEREREGPKRQSEGEREGQDAMEGEKNKSSNTNESSSEEAASRVTTISSSNPDSTPNHHSDGSSSGESSSSSSSSAAQQ